MLRPLLRTAYDLVAPRRNQSALAIIYADFPDRQRRFLFANPSDAEVAKNNGRLRLIGGCGEEGETPVQTLFREFREELVGHDTMEKIEQTGLHEGLSDLQKQALDLLERKQVEIEAQLGAGKIWSRQYNFNPDRFRKEQADWFRSTNHVYGVSFTPAEFMLLEKVGSETTKRDHKELSSITVITQDRLKNTLVSGQKIMGYVGEQNSLSAFLKTAAPAAAPTAAP